MRVMIPMKMEKECLECHRDTLVPVGGLRGGATISVDLNTYRTAQEPTWRTIQYWHFGIWLVGLTTIYAFWFFSRRRASSRPDRRKSGARTRPPSPRWPRVPSSPMPMASIRWVNDAFCAIYGYAREEVIGRNPRILKSGRHDAAFYRRVLGGS